MKVLSLLYKPYISCNLKCEYCYQWDENKAPVFNEVKVDVGADIEHLKALSKQENMLYFLSIHGGECMLSTPDELEKIFELADYCVDKKIGFQSNLTTLSDAQFKVLESNKDKIRNIGTTIDFPVVVHNKHRCNTSAKVLKNFERVHSLGVGHGVLVGIQRETLRHLDALKRELELVEQCYPKVNIIFRFIVSPDGFHLSDKEQGLFADYVIDNDLLRFLWKVADGDDGLQKVTLSCAHAPKCQWVSFRGGSFGYCLCRGKDFGATDLVTPNQVKELSAECKLCEDLEVCYGGCIGYRNLAGTDKSPICVFLKRIFKHYREVNHGNAVGATRNTT